MLLVIIVAIILIVPAAFFIIGTVISGPQYKGPVTDHFDGKKFTNPTGVEAKGLKDVLTWMTQRKRREWKEQSDGVYGKRPLAHYKDGIRITFVNHTTFLIQAGGLNILTDPVWSKRTSPFRWIGPKRMRPPGIKLEDLPRIDVILLSHNHYDHLDVATMRVLTGAHHPRIVTPLGVGAFLETVGIKNSTDTDWWDELALSEQIKVTSVPAQHFSGRGMLDRDKSLWCGYVLSTPHGQIYFAGDTGYNDKTFVEIGRKFESIRVSLIPIGAYKPEWFMSPIHVSPFEAVLIHKDVRSQKSIASHFGTFPLADDGADDPVEDLSKALRQNNLSKEEFITLTEGEALVID
jgi:L-ascorbate metabolism protein UlaG (beta-lactamase superfamily)